MPETVPPPTGVAQPTLWSPSGWERPRPAGTSIVPPEDPRWKRLREPFPNTQIGKLPRVWCPRCRDAIKTSHNSRATCDQHQARVCTVCRNNMTTGHLHLDYVGHAAVTSRLLEVDPHWSWRPMTAAEREAGGYPTEDRAWWIWLTVLGLSRPGFGDTEGKSGPDAMKARIGDAIKNAAMRFGVGLDLWSKEDLQADAEAKAESDDEVKRGLEEGDPDTAPREPSENWVELAKACTTVEEVNALATRCNEVGEFEGVAKATMAGRKRQLEAAARRAKQPPAES